MRKLCREAPMQSGIVAWRAAPLGSGTGRRATGKGARSLNADPTIEPCSALSRSAFFARPTARRTIGKGRARLPTL